MPKKMKNHEGPLFHYGNTFTYIAIANQTATTKHKNILNKSHEKIAIVQIPPLQHNVKKRTRRKRLAIKMKLKKVSCYTTKMRSRRERQNTRKNISCMGVFVLHIYNMTKQTSYVQ